MSHTQSVSPAMENRPSLSESDELSQVSAAKTTLLAQAIVFSTLSFVGAGLLIATLVTDVDSFYPLVGFSAAVYVAWRRFF